MATIKNVLTDFQADLRGTEKTAVAKIIIQKMKKILDDFTKATAKIILILISFTVNLKT